MLHQRWRIDESQGAIGKTETILQRLRIRTSRIGRDIPDAFAG
jgi:hypothetical protein